MSDYKATTSEFQTVANAIRTKGGTSASLAWPDGFASAIYAIPSGVTPSGSISISQNGTYDVSAFADAVVNVQGGGGGDSADEYIERTIANISNSTASKVGSYAFYRNISLIDCTMENVTTINEQAFYMCSQLQTVVFPACTKISASAFYSCFTLSSISFPNCVSIEQYAFSNAGKSTMSAYFPECTFVGSSAFCYAKIAYADFPKLESANYGGIFYNCSYLSGANLPNCKDATPTMFAQCSSLLSIEMPKCSAVYANAFSGCAKLALASFPECKSVYSNAFGGCVSLANIYLPECSMIGGTAFNYAGLADVEFPKCEIIGNQAFGFCSHLSVISLAVCSNISSYAFRDCKSLTSVYLLSGSVASLVNSNAFSSTPIANSTYTGTFGSIFVPASLVDAYKSAANWSYYSDRITAYVEG